MPLGYPHEVFVTDSPLPVVVAFCSQKGGVGKSTLARALACAAAKENGVKVRIVDADELQETAHAWSTRRAEQGIKPQISVIVPHRFTDLKQLAAPDDDILIIDAPGRASRDTLVIAKQAHLIVQPSAGSGDDLLPGMALYRELEEEGIPRERLVWALSRVDSEAEERDLRQFLNEQGWQVLKGCLFNRSAYKRAMDSGLSVTETPFKSLNEKAAELVDSLNDALKATVMGIYAETTQKTRKKTVMAA